MNWYDENNSVNRNVVSAEFKAEARDGQLWCVAECKVKRPLTPNELDILKDYVTGQASDGYATIFVMPKESGENAVIWAFFVVAESNSA